MPANASDEYHLLARRAVTNVMQLLVNAPAQSLAVDSYRRGSSADSTEWNHWRASDLAIRQDAIHRAALIFGHSFTVTEQTSEGARTRGLSPMRTAALYTDPASDLDPVCALTVTAWPTNTDGKGVPGHAILWTATHRYEVHFKGRGTDVRISRGFKHGSSACPVTRFAVNVDLEGRTTGVIGPFRRLQDRINQVIFDLLIAQSYASWAVRWATGMAPPMLTDPVYADPDDPTSEIIGTKPRLDANGQPIPAPINHNASRFLFAPDPDSKFGSLPGTPLSGYIEAVGMAFRHLSALAQLPPAYLVGELVNVAAEALDASEAGFLRMLGGLQTMLGAPWKRVFRLAAELDGQAEAALADDGEIVWRDIGSRSMAAIADALGKLATQLGVPPRALWTRIPGITGEELDYFERIAAEDSDGALARAIDRVTGGDAFSPAEPS
ncbi:chromosome partitioning protein ParA [Actinorhabdospora filicis]|uniref:Chromosome partitioning protein ParA n=2 Tax=Actinorhabdospora filicis TaxID=1785913 RepID=A0A9W6SVA3_9ACTN|nr:chromosome partitioning protein ParA [Actinorhabdospora filicis]